MSWRGCSVSTTEHSCPDPNCWHGRAAEAGLGFVAGPGPMREVLSEALEKLTAKNRSAIVYLLWSNKHGMWWAPDGRGYTDRVEDAGRYCEDDAVRYVVNNA